LNSVPPEPPPRSAPGAGNLYAPRCAFLVKYTLQPRALVARPCLKAIGRSHHRSIGLQPFHLSCNLLGSVVKPGQSPLVPHPTNWPCSSGAFNRRFLNRYRGQPTTGNITSTTVRRPTGRSITGWYILLRRLCVTCAIRYVPVDHLDQRSYKTQRLRKEKESPCSCASSSTSYALRLRRS
jgi:hypothetical protein